MVSGEGIAAADFNGDGYNDVALLDPNTGKVVVYQNDRGTLIDPPSFFEAGQDSRSIASSDLNGDDKNDLIVGNQSGRSVSILIAQ